MRYRQREEGLETAVTLPDPDAPILEQQAYRQSVLDCVRQALADGNDERREAMYLRFWGGLSVAETAVSRRKIDLPGSKIAGLIFDEAKAFTRLQRPHPLYGFHPG
jgi:hypothetical protein